MSVKIMMHTVVIETNLKSKMCFDNGNNDGKHDCSCTF